MKNSIVNTGKVMTGLAIVLLSAAMQAQPGPGNHRGAGYPVNTTAIPNLTEEQEQKITAMHTSHQKEVLNLRYDLDIKAATLQKLKSADNPDMSLINKTIDEMGALRTEIEKKNAVLGTSIRKILTEEQKIAWDTRMTHRGRGENCTPHAGRGISAPAGETYRHSEGKHNL